MSEPKKAAATAGKPKSSKSKPRAITDIAHPGTSAPSDTSKPIITHRPMMKDPMVVQGVADEPEGAPREPSLSRKSAEPKLTPSDETVAAASSASDEVDGSDEPDKSPEEQSADKADTPEPAAPESEPAPESEAELKPEPEASAPDESPDKDAPAPGKNDKKSKKLDPDAETAAQAEEEAKLQKLIDSKKYFLPINAVEQRRSKRFVILGVILAIVLAVAWVDVALDAGLIHLGGVKAVTHFFSN